MLLIYALSTDNNFVLLFFNRGDAQAKTGKAKDTQGNFKKKVAELKKKIKQTVQDANSCDDGMF